MNKEFFEEAGDLLLLPFRVVLSVFDADNQLAMFVSNTLIISFSFAVIFIGIGSPEIKFRIWEYILFGLSLLYSARTMFKPAYENTEAKYYYFALFLFALGCISLFSDKLLQLFQVA